MSQGISLWQFHTCIQCTLNKFTLPPYPSAPISNSVLWVLLGENIFLTVKQNLPKHKKVRGCCNTFSSRPQALGPCSGHCLCITYKQTYFSHCFSRLQVAKSQIICMTDNHFVDQLHIRMRTAQETAASLSCRLSWVTSFFTAWSNTQNDCFLPLWLLVGV
jgi:hypothetical protein